jgi:3D-(3,5/4)-trihydroxycyclohexane-1,2-dione acylhydrolase (decyclizing)
VPVDFLANARSLGATVFSADNEAALKAALAAARRQKNTCLIYVPVTPGSVMQGFSWWDVPPAAVSGVPTVRAARVRYDRARRQQRFLY